jgi:aldehyde:ferredoxin oxidoreductase
MALYGVTGKVAFVDLTQRRVVVEEMDQSLYRDYLGGYGLGGYLLHTRQKPGTDPLSPEAHLGFFTGPLTGTRAVTGNRFTVVGASPKTRGFGDANCGGRFGPALKQAGLDGIMVTGRASQPVTIAVSDANVRIRDAGHLRGLGCVATEDALAEELGDHAACAVIGPAGERGSLLACIINDRGRAAGRSGLGTVMGAKNLKAVAAVPPGNAGWFPAADEEGLKEFRTRMIREHLSRKIPRVDKFSRLGTTAGMVANVEIGDAPIWNWKGWRDHFSRVEEIGGDAIEDIRTGTYGCWKCPIACGAMVEIPGKDYGGTGHRPEYETLGALGSMTLCHDLEAICRANNMANDLGLDTISVGATVAFAMECFERGLVDAGEAGLDLSWGNPGAVVEMTRQLGTGQGYLGRVFGHGVARAVEHLGPEAARCAMHCGGEELPMHDPRCFPGLGASYVTDATPGRHTQFSAWTQEAGRDLDGLDHPVVDDPHDYGAKGWVHRWFACYGQIVNTAGICNFSTLFLPGHALLEELNLVMGLDMDIADLLLVGERTLALRQAFNLREGVSNPRDYRMPPRTLGHPPLEDGPTQGVSVDNQAQVTAFYQAMGWDPETGAPTREVLERLGLEFAADSLEA